MESLDANLLGNRISSQPALASLGLLGVYLEAEVAESRWRVQYGMGYCLVSTNLLP